MVGKIGAVSKRSPVKPVAKRVAKPVAKSAVKRVAKPGAKPGAKPAAKPGAKPAAKRAGVKRATPKAKKVNFNKLLIIIRNVANRTHKKGRMTGGGLEDAKNTILKYLISSDLTTAIIGLIKNIGVNAAGANYLLSGTDILKVGTGSLAELLSAIDTVCETMRTITIAPTGVNKDDIINIAASINVANTTNIANIEEINTKIASKDTTDSVGAVADAAEKDSKNPIAIEIKNKTSLDTAITIDDAFNKIKGVAISQITENSIKDKCDELIKKLTALKYDVIFEHIKITATIDEEVKRNFAMLMIAITLAKIHDIIKDM
jgi:hypothetical protein